MVSLEQTRSLATVPDPSEGIRWSCHRQGRAIRMAEVKSDNREGESEENTETKDQRVSDSSTTEVREGQLLKKVLVPSSAGMGQDWLQDGREGENSKEKVQD